ncbi:MAG: hypothetical protein BA865_14405 [Desulfobacterales bacterium S5133MH4]|nr:MAG: hypothetical protein BA865_14405 [Desulfobacterales bacterium S5133MH4]
MTTYKMIVLFCCISFISLLIGSAEFAWCTPWTPLEWQDRGKLREWVRDANRNFIDDLIDNFISSRPPDEKISITVAFNRCVTEPGRSDALDFLGGIGNVVYVGKVVTFAVVSDVSLSDISSIATHPEVAMVELYRPVIPALDISTRTIKVRAGVFPPTATFRYSPETVEDYDSDLIGHGINIAIIDSGVNNDHDSFRGSFVAGCDFTAPGHPGECVTGDPDDQSGHGTQVATVALGRGAPDGTYKGVAPGAGLIDIKIYRGEDNTLTYGAPEAAIEWIILNKDTDWGDGHARGIQVVNISFSGCDNSDGLSVLDQLVNAMAARDIAVVMAAGNRKTAECEDPASGTVTRIGSVAAASLGITVANSTLGPLEDLGFTSNVNRDNDEINVDSLRGPRIDGRQKPELAAPGTHIFWNMDDPSLASVGTSLSAPHVAGVASIIRQRIPEINPGSLKDLLIRTAHRPADPEPDVRNPTWDADWGYGLVDAYQAIWQVTGQGEAQTDLTFEGFGGDLHPPDPIWLSPAIRFNYDTEDVDVLLIGEPNEISVRIRNRGRDANNVRVAIGIYYFAASDPDRPQFYEIASLTRDLPVGITDINHTWTPSPDLDIFSDPDAHICLRASIDYGLDSDYSNYSNVAQRNLERVETSSPAVFKFRVENPLSKSATIHLDVRGDQKNPPGWTINLSDNDFVMNPFGCARNLELTVTPPDDAGPGLQATYHVYASGTTEAQENIPLGGLTVQAFVPGEPGMPFGIVLVIWAVILLAIIIAICFFVRRYRQKDPVL